MAAPMTKARRVAKRTIPAETSLAIWILPSCSFFTRSITSSKAVLVISAAKTKKIAIRIATHSRRESLNANPKIMTKTARKA